jgi:hypothetical protein
MMDASVECCVVMKICAGMLVIGLCSEIGCTDRFQWDGVDATDGGEEKGDGRDGWLYSFLRSEKVNAQL